MSIITYLAFYSSNANNFGGEVRESAVASVEWAIWAPPRALHVCENSAGQMLHGKAVRRA
jgi:hypothetical protein